MNDIEETIKLIKKYVQLTSWITTDSFYSKETYDRCRKVIKAYDNFLNKSEMIDVKYAELELHIKTIAKNINTLLITNAEIIIYKIYNTFSVPESFKSIKIRMELWEDLISDSSKTLIINNVNNITLTGQYLQPMVRAMVYHNRVKFSREIHRKILKTTAILYKADHYEDINLYFMELCIYYANQYINNKNIQQKLIEIQETLIEQGLVKLTQWFMYRAKDTLKGLIKNRKRTTGVKILDIVINKYNLDEFEDYSYNIVMITVLEIMGIWDE